MIEKSTIIKYSSRCLFVTSTHIELGLSPKKCALQFCLMQYLHSYYAYHNIKSQPNLMQGSFGSHRFDQVHRKCKGLYLNLGNGAILVELFFIIYYLFHFIIYLEYSSIDIIRRTRRCITSYLGLKRNHIFELQLALKQLVTVR